jgi:hypothetical protein
MTDDTAEKKQYSSWDHAEFASVLKRTPFEGYVSKNELPYKINLNEGVIGGHSEAMRKETLADPEKRERSRYGKITIDRRLLISNHSIIGNKTDVAPHAEIFSNDLPVLNLHTHGIVDLPPSPMDIRILLPSLQDGGLAAIIVITPSMRFLLLRTKETPRRSAGGIDNIISEHKNETVRQMADEMRQYNNWMSQFGGASKDQIKTQEYKINSTIQMPRVVDLCQTNNIAIYTAQNGNLYTKVSA